MKKLTLIAGMLMATFGSAAQAQSACLMNGIACMTACKSNLPCMAACQAEVERCGQRTADAGDDADDADQTPRRPTWAPSAIRLPLVPFARGDGVPSGASEVRQREGVVAPDCVHLTKLRGGFNVSDLEVANRCAAKVEVHGACMSGANQVRANYPYPGTFGFSSGWMMTMGAGAKRPDPSAEACSKSGGRVVFAACSQGTPHFTSRDGSQFRCYQ